MASKKTIKIILIPILLIVFLISFSTKAAFWDHVDNKDWARKTLDEVAPGAEGVIVIDVFLFLAFCVALLLTLKSTNRKLTVILIGFILISLFLRFILALLFLAGNDNFCKKTIDQCNNQGYNSYCASDMIRNLKVAWSYEIFAFIVVNLFVPLMIFMFYKYTEEE